jgi:hypothetical protein
LGNKTNEYTLKYFLFFSFLLFINLLIYFSDSLFRQHCNADKIKGITMVAPPGPFPNDPMIAIKKTNANWVAIIPYGFSRKGKPEVHYAATGFQWWGEKPDGIRESVRLAKIARLHVMLKPQVWIHDDWVGNMDFSSEAEWTVWEHDYKNYILFMARLASELQIEMLCIATEYDKAAIKRSPFFRNLISEIKIIYSGKLCYSASWNNYENISFWDELDYVGISAYFPLCDDKTPETNTLIQHWQQYTNDLELFAHKINKNILFTEFGYLSVDGCAGKSWEIEKQVDTLSINQKAQSNAYNAMFSSLWSKSWWAGGFVWKWFPNGEGHEGFPDKDYTPQGKEAEQILKQWYEKHN